VTTAPPATTAPVTPPKPEVSAAKPPPAPEPAVPKSVTPEPAVPKAVTPEIDAPNPIAPEPAARSPPKPDDAARPRRRVAGARVAALVETYESLTRAAEEDARRVARIMSEKDPTKVARYFAARRKFAAERKADQKANNRAREPELVNVAPDGSRVVVEVRGAEGCAVEVAVDRDGSGCPEKWAKGGRVATVDIDAPGEVVVYARATAPGKEPSAIASGVFWLSPPDVRAEGRVLAWAGATGAAAAEGDAAPPPADAAAEGGAAPPPADATASAFCGVCGAPLAATRGRGDFYASSDDFLCCYGCARKAQAGSATAPPLEEATSRRVSVDAGAKRIWLSEPVAFVGNKAVVKPSSFPMLGLLAGTLRRNPGLCVRLEGHTNSGCGAECVGTFPCANETCFENFYGRGGAVGFSRDRAAAVRDWLLAPDGGKLGKEDALRISAAGLGGARRLVDDTEAPDNWKNRRVEAHIVDFAETAGA